MLTDSVNVVESVNGGEVEARGMRGVAVLVILFSSSVCVSVTLSVSDMCLLSDTYDVWVCRTLVCVCDRVKESSTVMDVVLVPVLWDRVTVVGTSMCVCVGVGVCVCECVNEGAIGGVIDTVFDSLTLRLSDCVVVSQRRVITGEPPDLGAYGKRRISFVAMIGVENVTEVSFVNPDGHDIIL
eukprot:PhM_4_TR9001/c0_g1_i1/m.2374